MTIASHIASDLDLMPFPNFINGLKSLFKNWLGEAKAVVSTFRPTVSAVTAAPAQPGNEKPQHKARPRVRALLIAEGANPVLTSASLVGWSCATAIAKVTDAHIVTEWRNRDDFLRAGLIEGKDFTAIHARRSQGIAWRLARLMSDRGHFSWSLYAIFSNLAYPFFERAVWKEFGPRLRAGEFDVVHRILPLSPTTPSWIAGRLKRFKVPFVMGPLNGGVAWPKGFKEVRRQEKDWAGRLRSFYRFLPGHRRTRRQSQAIITAARSTWREIPEQHHDKCVFIPENAIDTTRFPLQPKPPRAPGPLRIAFVGRLVALKGVDMLLEASAPLARAGRVQIDLIGDGPEMGRLRQQVERLQIQDRTRLDGWTDHTRLQPRLQESDVLVLPSIREFGGGVVLEAMALGLSPIVLDHGGPPELVPPGTGYVLPLKTRDQVITDLRELLDALADDPASLVAMGCAAQTHIRRHFTWEAKALQIRAVYDWMLGHRDTKPHWGMPMGMSL